jgi:hypothetical protein
VRGESSRVKGEEPDESYFELHRLGDRLLLFQASRDSLLSLVRGSRLQRRLFFIILSSLETVIGIDLMLERLYRRHHHQPCS